MKRKDLDEVQTALAKKLLLRVQEIPFYKNKFKEQGFDPAKFKDLSELKHLPFTQKTDLRDNYPLAMLACKSSEIKRFHASSGTRGKPTLVAYTALDLENWSELGARCLFAAGVRQKHLVHNAYGYGLFTGGLGMHAAVERLGAACLPASGGKSSLQATLIADLRPKVLLCTPSYSLRLAEALKELGLGTEEISLEIGIFGAEPWSEAMRLRIEQELGLKAIDIYGLSEIMGPGVSIECTEARNGLHVFEDHFLAEIIDPKTLEILPDGQEGELVLTTLQKEAMPLIRYRTGDLSSIDRSPCICGRTMLRMKRVKARIDDMLIIRGVNVYPSEIENILLKVSELAPHYQLLLKTEKSMDHLSIQVELSSEITALWSQPAENGSEHLSARIQEQIKATLGLSINVELMPASSIQRSEGKALRLLDLRN